MTRTRTPAPTRAAPAARPRHHSNDGAAVGLGPPPRPAAPRRHPRITPAGSPTPPPPAAASAPSGSPGSCTPSRRPPAASSTPATPIPTCPTGCSTSPAATAAPRLPPCAETYRADTYQLIRAGLAGGKGVPTIRRHPPGRVRDPHRALLRARPHPDREPRRREGRAPAACAATSPSARTAAPHLHRPAHREPPLPRPADLPGLLRPRPARRLERLGRRTLAPHHHHPRPRC